MCRHKWIGCNWGHWEGVWLGRLGDGGGRSGDARERTDAEAVTDQSPRSHGPLRPAEPAEDGDLRPSAPLIVSAVLICKNPVWVFVSVCVAFSGPPCCVCVTLTRCSRLRAAWTGDRCSVNGFPLKNNKIKTRHRDVFFLMWIKHCE